MWKLISVVFVSTLFWSSVLSDDCTTPTGRRSNCVSLYDCPELLAGLQQQPVSSEVATYLRQSKCGYDGAIPRVCCGPFPEPSRPNYVTSRPNYQPTTGGDDNSPEDSSPTPDNQCGIDTNGDRIFGGVDTDIDEFPWMALLGYRQSTGGITYQCGGALINRRYVVTAAHCITGEIEIKVGTLVTVRLGEYDTQKAVDCQNSVCADPPQEIPVASAYPHPTYNDKDKSRAGDIGVVRLAQRATYSYYVKPICLPSTNARLGTGFEVVVAGWGKTLSGKNSNLKLKLAMEIFSKEDCVRKYYDKFGAVIGDKQLCAGGEFAKDTCRGDSGGPLMKRRPNGAWEAVGIVSFGHLCGADGWPGVYTSVAGYADWIRQTLQSTNQ